jgi:hypothetical protein
MQSTVYIFPIFLLLAFGQVVAQKERPAAFVLPSKEQPGLHVTYRRGTEIDFATFIDRHPKLKQDKWFREEGAVIHFMEFRLTGLGKIEDIRLSANMPDWAIQPTIEAIKESERYWIPKRMDGKPADTHIVYMRTTLVDFSENPNENADSKDRAMRLKKAWSRDKDWKGDRKAGLPRELYPQYAQYYWIENTRLWGLHYRSK